MKTMILLMALALVSVASAQLDPEPDGMGIYFDMGGTEVCYSTMAPFESVTAYLLLTNMSNPDGIDSWEASLEVIGNPVAPQWFSAFCPISIDNPMILHCGPGPALPAAPVVVLATWTGFVQSPTDVIEFQISGIDENTPPRYWAPGWIVPNDAHVFMPFPPEGPGRPSAFIAPPEQCHPLSGDDATFGTLKALYR